MMMGESKQLDWHDMKEAVPGFLTLVMMPFTYRRVVKVVLVAAVIIVEVVVVVLIVVTLPLSVHRLLVCVQKHATNSNSSLLLTHITPLLVPLCDSAVSPMGSCSVF